MIRSTCHLPAVLARLALAVILTAYCVGAYAQGTFLIGNSLTDNGAPWALSGLVQYHIEYGKNLPYIYANPDNPIGTPGTIPWNIALASHQYDYLSVEPYRRATLGEDVAVISAWMAMQPDAIVVLHTGWPFLAEWDAALHSPHSGNVNDPMNYSPEYFSVLRQKLLEIDPTREIRTTRLNEALDKIYHDIDSGDAPYAAFSDLYRDDIHLNWTDGSYLVHNALRIALGQPVSAAGYSAVPPDHVAYLNSVLQAVVVNKIDGDFDNNYLVNGSDLLMWQRGGASPIHLADWDENFGMSSPALPTSGVPEPATLGLVCMALAACRRLVRG